MENFPVTHLIRKDAFTADECERIIRLGLLQPLEPAYAPGMKIDPDVRSSFVRFIYSADDNIWLFRRLWQLLQESPFTDHITTLNFVQFTEYKAEYGGKFAKHRDTEVFYHPHNSTDMVRKVTCMVQLSDERDYDDGELVLYPPNESKITGPRCQGCAIMFPSKMVHEAKKVTKGTRYSLVAWFEGPR